MAVGGVGKVDVEDQAVGGVREVLGEPEQDGQQERAPASRGSTRPATHGSGMSSHTAASTLAFSAYDDTSSEVQSNVSGASYQGEESSEGSASPNSGKQSAPPSPTQGRKETIYVDDIYKKAIILERPSTTEDRTSSSHWSHEQQPSRVFFCLTTGNALRQAAIKIHHHVYFKLFVHLVVAIHYLLVASAPVGWGDVDASLHAKRGFFDFVTVVLTVEFALKSATFGVLMTPCAVLRSPVCVLELAIVVLSWSDGGSAGRHVLGACSKSVRLLWLLPLVYTYGGKRTKWLHSLSHGIISAVHALCWSVT